MAGQAFFSDRTDSQTINNLRNRAPAFNAYDMEYYTPAQISVYFGNIWIDEIIALQYDFQHNKQPIYGYSDVEWATVAYGQKIVTGSFAINFKENAYLLLVLNFLKNTSAISVEGGGHTVTRDRLEAYVREKIAQSSSKINDLLYDPAQKAEITVLETLYGFIDGARPASGASPRKNFQDAEQMMDILENQIWSQGSGGTGQKGLSKLHSPTEHKAFDIFLAYGDYNNPAANHTGKKINEVHLTGQSQTIAIGGQTVVEVYPFIARNIDDV